MNYYYVSSVGLELFAMLVHNKMAHIEGILQVDREKKRAAAAAAREKREQAANSWFGWLKGGGSKAVRSCKPADSCSICSANL